MAGSTGLEDFLKPADHVDSRSACAISFPLLPLTSSLKHAYQKEKFSRHKQ